MVIDYSRRLVRFIVEVKNNDQHTSIHDNKCCQRSKNKVTMARTLFEQYDRNFGNCSPSKNLRGKWIV
jgi:hypothetical protein